ncbi:T-cell-specific guanine nucleotide triphosphate-binding protein 2-like [Mercenaria mercenaria]|uniref:T-cell-specific guanine nucleotide triphosphate-binding protein 2-like n=1 Tax=Mercenaria mercenaria TaxID=6596 RepID=UPI00234F0AE5|nr:T-cell-specific guanine nucleotide triphosphate-binding protein 2-like [Mercenaria mercenaria]
MILLILYVILRSNMDAGERRRKRSVSGHANSTSYRYKWKVSHRRRIASLSRESSDVGQCEKNKNDYHRFRSFVQKDKLSARMKEYGYIHGLNMYIAESIEIWKRTKVKVAVAGNAGVGKSSLINALRGMQDNDDDAAEVGVVETTATTRKYPYPENKLVALYDVPGVGTSQYPTETYLNEVGISTFDVVVIVSADRFKETDLWLAKQCLHLSKNIVFVRTKIDIDIMNEKRVLGKHFNADECLDKIRVNITDNTNSCPESRRIFLVSSVDRSMYDFWDLDKYLKSLLNIRGEAISNILLSYVKESISKKSSIGGSHFLLQKTLSGICGFLPIPYLETLIDTLSVSEARKTCLRNFCLDDTSLHCISQELQTDVEDLKVILNSYKQTVLPDGATIHSRVERKEFSPIHHRYSKYVFPVIGSFISTYKSYSTMDACLDEIIDVMLADVCMLIEMRLTKLETEMKPF